MKIQEAVELFKAGKSIVVVEVRSSKAEEITVRDKKNPGQTRVMKFVRHSVEADGASVILTEWKDEKFDPATYKAAFPKGTKAIVAVRSLASEAGVTRMSGELLPLE